MILDDFNLVGKTAIVTGAATGLGQAISIGLAEAGADISAVGHTTSLEQTGSKVKQFERNFLSTYCDLEDLSSTEKIVARTLEKFDHIDILVNCAGINIRESAEDYSIANWDKVININLRSLFFLTQQVGNQMINQGNGGKIINICSMLSYSGGILVSPYTASKSGVAGLTRLLANEWANYDINVNGIAPGYMATELTKPLREDEERNQEILSRIPMDRWGVPDDLKGAAVFLASNASNYVTGTILRVDGGWLTR